jgi:hypothetical protein
MPQTRKQSSAKAKKYKRSRNANLSTSKKPINPESQKKYRREKKKSHRNDDSSHSSTGDMGKTDRKKRGTEDIDSDRDSISSTSEGSYVTSPDNSGRNKRKRRKQQKKKSHQVRKNYRNDDESSSLSWCSSSSTTSSNSEHVILYDKYLKKFKLMLSSLDDKMMMCKYPSVNRQSEYKRIFKEVFSIVKLSKDKVKAKGRGGIKSWDYMFHAWVSYGEEYPEKKNSVCIETHYRLNNWVKEQRRKFTNGNLSEERYRLLMTNGFAFAPRKAVPSEEGTGVSTIAASLQVQQNSVRSEQVRGVPMMTETLLPVRGSEEVPIEAGRGVWMIANSLPLQRNLVHSEHGTGVWMLRDPEQLQRNAVPSEHGTDVWMIAESLLPVRDNEEVPIDEGAGVWMIADSLQHLRDSEELPREQETTLLITELAESQQLITVSKMEESLPPQSQETTLLITELAESQQPTKVSKMEESLPPQLKDKQQKPGNQSRMFTRSQKVIDVDTLPSQPSSQVHEALFSCDGTLTGDEKLDLLLKSPYVTNNDNDRAVALYIDEEKSDHPLLFIDVWRYKNDGWVSNHFVGCYYFLLNRYKRFVNDDCSIFLDTSFWGNYIMADSLSPRSKVLQLRKVFRNYKISLDSVLYIPALVNNNHFICFVVNFNLKLVEVYDSLDQHYPNEVGTLTKMLSLLEKSDVAWTVEDNYLNPSIARQRDTHSCGFFVCFYALQHTCTGNFSWRAFGDVAKLKKTIMISLLERRISGPFGA